jgi:hypothetical protein
MLGASDEGATPVVEVVRAIVSLVATCLGLAVIIIGLFYAMEVFRLIFSTLQTPVVLTEPIRQLAESFGGDAFNLALKDRSIPLAKLLALIVYCGGGLLAAWLTLAIMHTGANIVSLTAGDRSAVKKLLQSAFGSRMQPKDDGERRR